MTRARFSVIREGEDVELEIEFSFRPGSKDYYDRMYGWQPGDPPEVEIEKIFNDDGEEIDFEFTAAEELALDEKLCEEGYRAMREDWPEGDD